MNCFADKNMELARNLYFDMPDISSKYGKSLFLKNK